MAAGFLGKGGRSGTGLLGDLFQTVDCLKGRHYALVFLSSMKLSACN